MLLSLALVATSTIAVGVLAGHLEARRLLARYPGLGLHTVLGQARYLVAVALLVPLLVGAQWVLARRPGLAWRLPLFLQLHQDTLVWGSVLLVFAFLFALAVTVAVRTHHPERGGLALAGVLLHAGVLYAQWQYSAPIEAELGERVTTWGEVLQTSPFSCTAATAANIARVLGQVRTEREMAGHIGVTMLGATPARFIRGMASVGLRCEQVERPERDAAHLSAPALLFVDHPSTGPEGHAVAYLGQEEGLASVWDPLDGQLRLSAEQLLTLWHGRAITCVPAAGER